MAFSITHQKYCQSNELEANIWVLDMKSIHLLLTSITIVMTERKFMREKPIICSNGDKKEITNNIRNERFNR